MGRPHDSNFTREQTSMLTLADFERSGRGETTRFDTPVKDNAGIQEHELIITGTPEMVKRMLGDTTMTIDIDPSVPIEIARSEIERGMAAETRGRKPCGHSKIRQNSLNELQDGLAKIARY